MLLELRIAPREWGLSPMVGGRRGWTLDNVSQGSIVQGTWNVLERRSSAPPPKKNYTLKEAKRMKSHIPGASNVLQVIDIYNVFVSISRRFLYIQVVSL